MLEQLYSPFFLSLKIDGMTNIGDGVILEGEDNGTVVLMNHLTGFEMAQECLPSMEKRHMQKI